MATLPCTMKTVEQTRREEVLRSRATSVSVVIFPPWPFIRAARAARSGRGVRARTCGRRLAYEPLAGRGRAIRPSGRARMSPDATLDGGVVAGIIENDESPEQLIRREAVEEAGSRSRRLSPCTTCGGAPVPASEEVRSLLGGSTRRMPRRLGLESEGEQHPGQVMPSRSARMLERDEIGKRGRDRPAGLALNPRRLRARWR